MRTDTASVEEVLNSRCSSQFDTGPPKSHWGTFIDQPPPRNVVDNVLRCCNIPRFSGGELTYWLKEGHLYLGFEKPEHPDIEKVLHVESGMQQEAVYLACIAQGVGTCIHNQGINGTQYGERMATARHLIREVADPYQTGRFTTEAPGPKKPFIAGSKLCEPSRAGDLECLPALEHLTRFNESGSSATERDISQLLWAGKGRTPHCVRVHVWNLQWGLTIPTWGGGQDYTSVYLIRDGQLFLHINWTKKFSLLNRLFRQELRWTRGNPTHDLRFIQNLRARAPLNETDTAIVLCRNEQTGRALWEVGYILENMFLQAKSLGISYGSKILDTNETLQLAELGVSNPVAAVLI